MRISLLNTGCRNLGLALAPNEAQLVVMDMTEALIGVSFISKILCKARTEELIDECISAGHKVSPLTSTEEL